MGYGFDDSVKDSEHIIGNFIQVTKETAIAAGRFIKELSAGTTDNGYEYLDVIVEDDKEASAKKRYFKPVMGDILKTKVELENAESKFSRVVANISRRFLGESYTLPKMPTFLEFVNKIIADIGDKYKDVELRVKVVLDKNNFPTLPNYAPIFELASVPQGESKLKIASFDKVESTGRASTVEPDSFDEGHNPLWGTESSTISS